jgi:nitrogen PTS system EIIA component
VQLTAFIPRAAVFANLEVNSKTQTLRALCDALFHEEPTELAQIALARVLAREGTQSTAIGHGIALPHAPVAELGQLRCAVGRIQAGLDFGAVDKQPVKLVFLICYPPLQQSLYLNFVATVAKLLRQEKHLRELLEAENADDLFGRLATLSKLLEMPEKVHAPGNEAEPETSEASTSASELFLLARLDLCSEMLETATSGKEEIEQRMTNLSALIDPNTLRQYQRLKKTKQRVVVALENGVCQGCFARLPHSLIQMIQTDKNGLHRCGHCNRFLYAI